MRRLAIAIAAMFVAGCADSTSPNEHRTAGLVIWASGPTSDTVYAGPVTVRARLLDDRLQPVVGAMINFSALLSPDSFLGAFAGPNAATPISPTFSSSTDARGEAAVRLWHGWLAGTGTVKAYAIEASSPSTIVDSASIPLVTLPGHALSVRVSPRDTALFKGNSATIIGQVLDRFGNIRDERAAITALTAGLSVSGNTVTATADPSRQRLLGAWQGLTDTGYVSIVPQGSLTVSVHGRPGPASDYTFASFRLDGSGFTPFLSRLVPPHYGSCCADLGPQWEPGDSTLIFFDGSDYPRLFRTTREGVVSPVLLSSEMSDDVWPQVTADGQWVYFARTTRATNQSYIFRSHRDGSQLEQVTASAGPYTNDLYPSPSPDGRYVVYATDRESYGNIFNLRLQIVDTQTGAVRSLGVAGTIPRWSPNGDLIVFGQGDALWLVAPDGTGFRQLGLPGRAYKAWASWSPDGKWIAAEHSGPNIDIIEVATGTTLPLGFTGYLGVPTWQRH